MILCLHVLLLDPFQQYLEMSVVLFICTASEKNCTVGNGNVLLEFFLVGGGGVVGNSDSKVGLHVIAEKMKICSYFHVGKCSYPWDVS